MRILSPIHEKLRVKTRDEYYAALNDIGVKAEMVERGRPEEGFGIDHKLMEPGSKGLIRIFGSPIEWVNIRAEVGGDSGYFYADSLVPGNEIEIQEPVDIRAVPVKERRGFLGIRQGGTLDFKLAGKGIGSDAIQRLNVGDVPWNLFGKIRIGFNPQDSYWRIRTQPQIFQFTSGWASNQLPNIWLA